MENAKNEIRRSREQKQQVQKKLHGVQEDWVFIDNCTEEEIRARKQLWDDLRQEFGDIYVQMRNAFDEEGNELHGKKAIFRVTSSTTEKYTEDEFRNHLIRFHARIVGTSFGDLFIS